MKRTWITLSVATLVLTAANVGTARAADEQEQKEQKIAFKQAPAAVRKTLKHEARGQKIKTVDKEKLKGKTVYEADVVIDGHNYEIVVNETGLLLSKKLDEEGEEAEAKEAHKDVRRTEKNDQDDAKADQKNGKEQDDDKAK